MKLPTLYQPTEPDQFLGPARTVAKLIDQAILDANENDRAPMKILLLGEPGTGKSALAHFAMRRLRVDKWSLTKLNGAQVGLETVDELARQTQYKDMFGSWRGFQVEEVDQITPKAQVRILTLLDDLPNGNAVVCTSNCQIAELESRFQSRWKFFEVKGAPDTEIIKLLVQFGLDLTTANQIAAGCRGNVRQALLDCEQALQAKIALARKVVNQ